LGAWNATGNQFADRRASASFASRIWTGWLRALDRGLSAYSGEQMILVQYVPRMYGWKSMNLPFCCWLARLRRNVWVMFHEVAFPFLTGQPLRHKVLAIVHRLMARIVLSGANRSFTSIEPYQQMLQWLAPKARPELLRIFSNVSFREIRSHRVPRASDSRFVIGTFSNFQPEICQLLAKALPVILENPIFHIRLVGPGENFVLEFVRRFPQFRDRLSTTGRLDVANVGLHLENCDALLQLYPDGACGARGTFIAALASGVPVVSTAGHLTEFILKRSGAIAFSEREPTAIRETLEKVYADPAYARMISEAARRLYADEFSIDVTLERFHEAAGRSSGQHGPHRRNVLVRTYVKSYLKTSDPKSDD